MSVSAVIDSSDGSLVEVECRAPPALASLAAAGVSRLAVSRGSSGGGIRLLAVSSRAERRLGCAARLRACGATSG